MEKKDSKKCLSDAEYRDERFLHNFLTKQQFIFQKKTLFEHVSA